MILDSPINATVAAGDGVTFQCRSNGTLDWPLWDIGGTLYYSSHLPAGFVYTDEGLHIPAVWESLNNTVFACLFIVHVGGGKLARIESSPAYLTVCKRNESENQLPTNSQTDINTSNTPTLVNVTSQTPASKTNSTSCSCSDGLATERETALSAEVGEFHLDVNIHVFKQLYTLTLYSLLPLQPLLLLCPQLLFWFCALLEWL